MSELGGLLSQSLGNASSGAILTSGCSAFLSGAKPKGTSFSKGLGSRSLSADCTCPWGDPRDPARGSRKSRLVLKATPLLWKLSEGLGRGLSLDAGCVYMHLFAMGSLMLGSLKARKTARPTISSFVTF